MTKLALLLSLLALGALGLVACGGDDDDEATAASETETTVGSGGQTATSEADPENDNRLTLKERIGTKANEWAALFAAGRDSWRFMGQPAGERMSCERVPNRHIKNCMPPSVAFRQSFADARVERVALKPHHHSMAQFSNGESVEFQGPAPWLLTERWVKRITRSQRTGTNPRLRDAERIERRATSGGRPSRLAAPPVATWGSQRAGVKSANA